MTKDEQERFEDYLILEHCIETLQASKQVHPPVKLDAQQMQAYRMLMLLNTTSLEHSEPRPEFVEHLESLLATQLEEQQDHAQVETTQPSIPPDAPSIQKQPPQPAHAPEREIQQAPSLEARRKMRRRMILTGGAAAAASFLAGAAIEHVATPQALPPASPPPPQPNNQYKSTTPLLGANTATTWHFVADVSELRNDALRFATDALVGYILRNDENKVIAFSAACTHMGCLVKWQGGTQRQFVCPCHDGRFDEYGNPATGASKQLYLTSLPQLDVKVELGKVYVKVPADNSTAQG
jgi:Rieske Fe-S protein